jgi:ADP-ribose pyrophosphatase YjhB (NUDIX family)
MNKKDACTSCGYTVDPNCDVCKGTGECDTRAPLIFSAEPGPATDLITAAEDTDFQQRVSELVTASITKDVEPPRSVLLGYRLEWRPGDYVYQTPENYAKEVGTESARVRGLYTTPQLDCPPEIEVYKGWCWQRPGKLLYPSLKGFTPLYLGPVLHEPPAEKGPAIDLIGCALVALKAQFPSSRTPQVLLGKRKKEEGFDHWVLPGGKQNSDESPEDCVRRETREEIGVSNLVGLRPVSFSYNNENPTRKYLMLYFTAYVAGEEPKITAHHEFSDLKWFEVDMLPAQMWQSDRDAIANTLLMRPR